MCGWTCLLRLAPSLKVVVMLILIESQMPWSSESPSSAMTHDSHLEVRRVSARRKVKYEISNADNVLITTLSQLKFQRMRWAQLVLVRGQPHVRHPPFGRCPLLEAVTVSVTALDHWEGFASVGYRPL